MGDYIPFIEFWYEAVPFRDFTWCECGGIVAFASIIAVLCTWLGES